MPVYAEQIDAFVRAQPDRSRGGPAQVPLPPSTAAARCRLQRDVNKCLSEKVVGRIGGQIGGASPEFRSPFSSDEPVYPGIFRHTLFSSFRRAFSLPLIGCEVAFRLTEDAEEIVIPGEPGFQHEEDRRERTRPRRQLHPPPQRLLRANRSRRTFLTLREYMYHEQRI